MEQIFRIDVEALRLNKRVLGLYSPYVGSPLLSLSGNNADFKIINYHELGLPPPNFQRRSRSYDPHTNAKMDSMLERKDYFFSLIGFAIVVVESIVDIQMVTGAAFQFSLGNIEGAAFFVRQTLQAVVNPALFHTCVTPAEREKVESAFHNGQLSFRYFDSEYQIAQLEITV